MPSKISPFGLRVYIFELQVGGDNLQGYLLAFRVLLHASGAIVCNLESVKRRIERHGVSPEKVHAVFSLNYPAEEIPAPLPTAVGQIFLWAHEPRLFSYTMFRREFTPEVLFEAFAHVCEEFPRAELLIAGPHDVPPEISAMIKHWKLESRVLVSRNLAHNQFLTAVQRSDVLIRTHLRGGPCASVFEALNLSVSVVAVEDGIRPPPLITYDPPEASVLLATLTRVLTNSDPVRSQTQSPNVSGNLDGEVSLLLSVATGESR